MQSVGQWKTPVAPPDPHLAAGTGGTQPTETGPTVHVRGHTGTQSMPDAMQPTPPWNHLTLN